MKCLLVPSHVNLELERGFSINKHMINIFGTSIEESTLESIYFIKDYLVKIGSFLNAPMTKQVIKSCGEAHKKCQSYLDEKEKNCREKLLF